MSDHKLYELLEVLPWEVKLCVCVGATVPVLS